MSAQEVQDQNEVLKLLTKSETFKELSEIDPTRSLRVNVLGASGAGKTSVVQALTLYIPTSQKKHRHTVGIDRYYLPVQIGGRTVLLHIWDHAGDNEYAMMNDLFISDNSLVWLVVNLKEYHPKVKDVKKDKRLFMDSIGNWLLQVMSHNSKPIVWIIGTHCEDKDVGNMVLKRERINHWIDDLCQSFETSLSDASINLKQCRHSEDLSKKLQHIEDLRKANVPAFVKNHMQIIELTNTYGFEGSKRIYKYFDSLEMDCGSALPNLTAPLCKTWQDGLDSLQLYAEHSTNNLPAISLTQLKSVTQVSSSEEFVEYLHDVGEVYVMKSSTGGGQDTVILSINCMIILLKEVYRHDFQEKMEEEKSELERLVDTALLDSAIVMRDDGVISEVLLKHLWKLTNKEDLFVKIIELFKKIQSYISCTV